MGAAPSTRSTPVGVRSTVEPKAFRVIASVAAENPTSHSPTVPQCHVPCPMSLAAFPHEASSGHASSKGPPCRRSPASHTHWHVEAGCQAQSSEVKPRQQGPGRAETHLGKFVQLKPNDSFLLTPRCQQQKATPCQRPHRRPPSGLRASKLADGALTQREQRTTLSTADRSSGAISPATAERPRSQQERVRDGERETW